MHFQSKDGVSQSEIGEAIHSNSITSILERDIYEGRELKHITLGQLKTQFEGEHIESANSNLLRARTRIILQDEDQYPPEDPLTLWNSCADRRLDYICTMGDRCGLDAALSKRAGDMGYEFMLCIQPHLSFAGKYAQLGADQKESLLKIGSRPGEEVYIYMCPNEVLEDPEVRVPKPGHSSGPTRMLQKHARILMAFIAHCLSKMRDETAVYCNEEYGIPLPPQPMNWSFTNA